MNNCCINLKNIIAEQLNIFMFKTVYKPKLDKQTTGFYNEIVLSTLLMFVTAIAKSIIHLNYCKI